MKSLRLRRQRLCNIRHDSLQHVYTHPGRSGLADGRRMHFLRHGRGRSRRGDESSAGGPRVHARDRRRHILHDVKSISVQRSVVAEEALSNMRTIHIFNAVAATSDKYSMALTVAEAAGIRKGLVAVAASAASSQVFQGYILRIATGGTVALVGPSGPKWKLGPSASRHQDGQLRVRGLDTTVGDRGAQLSGGQKRRITLIATSAPESSGRFVETRLDAPLTLKNRTTVIVAPSIQHIDFITVYAGGGIVELGMRDQLLQLPRGGVYQTLVSKQM
ncbi:hypothetical protein DYB38_011937 [Aphanomyces astaci]|uniref:ABC transporter domain-containing protein n=1 Tax=Aphanomyces astaci TaxID=112090 RepID=A0A397CXS0_APHAT|nr:hypothetical protein DYB38_011937 [Aphanomyces astaci]